SGGAIDNFGLIDIIGDSSISNDALSNTQLTIDVAKTLTLDHATIAGGTVTDNGELDLTGSGVVKSGTLGNTGQIKVSGPCNALDGETVTNRGIIKVLAGGALTLDQLTTVANGSASITVDGASKLTLNQATVTGGTVTDNGE